jgi:hypothetical protein
MIRGHSLLGLAAALMAFAAIPDAQAKPIFKCDVPSKCDDPELVAFALDEVREECPCEEAASARDYKQCWKPVLKDLAKDLGKEEFPKACEREVAEALNASICGRPDFVLCRKVKGDGRESCQVVKEDKCDEEFPPSSACGAFTNCFEACNPDACTTTTTTVPTTSTTFASTTTTATSSTTSTSVVDLCGNGVIDAGEECDTEDFGDATCPGSSVVGAFLECTPECTIDFSNCPGASTTTTMAPTTSTSLATTTSTTSTTSTTVDLCGNGVIDAGEECDTEDFGDATCPGSSVVGAFLECTAECTIDFSNCPGATTTSTLAPTTSTSLVTTTTSTSSSTTSTSVAPSTTSTSVAPTTTSTSSSSSTSSTSSSTSTTSSSSTTTSTAPLPEPLRFTTGLAGGVCGESRDGGAAGTILNSLTCGGLNIGGGGATVPEGPTPAGADTFFTATCSGGSCTVTARTAAQTGSNNNCSDTGCSFGPPLSIANGGLSTCVLNSFASPASGTVTIPGGVFDGGVPLSSAVTVTGNNAEPCPPCIASACASTASNPGAACTAINAANDSYECLPSGVALVPFPVNLTPIGTGTVIEEDANGTFCPGQDATAPGMNGCFGDPTCDYIEARGAEAAGLTSGGAAVTGRLASVFCIPATGNGLIDGAADLPGPGEVTLPGTFELN